MLRSRRELFAGIARIAVMGSKRNLYKQRTSGGSIGQQVDAISMDLTRQ